MENPRTGCVGGGLFSSWFSRLRFRMNLGLGRDCSSWRGSVEFTWNNNRLRTDRRRSACPCDWFCRSIGNDSGGCRLDCRTGAVTSRPPLGRPTGSPTPSMTSGGKTEMKTMRRAGRLGCVRRCGLGTHSSCSSLGSLGGESHGGAWRRYGRGRRRELNDRLRS